MKNDDKHEQAGKGELSLEELAKVSGGRLGVNYNLASNSIMDSKVAKNRFTISG